jgi:hypothetical protein
MQEFPLSKLKIKIRGVDNPTSVFKKRSYLSLNCIQKSNKSKTPLRIFTSDELPHYMMPIKCHLNKTENNYRSQIRLKVKKPAVKLSILSKNKTDYEMKVIQDNNNKIDNVYDIITVNKNNLNTNFNQDTRLNDCSSSNKDNNENIISELNIINQNNNNINNSFEEPAYNSLISELQKKISEQNILLSTRNKEIEKLKQQINKNNDIIKNYEQNNIDKNLIIKLEEEIKNLKEEMETLNNKYKNELNDKTAIEEKYQFLKNNMKNNIPKEKDIKNYENKIIEQENKISDLEEELNELKNKKSNLNLKISKELNFEIVKQNKNEINELYLSEKQYNDIQIIINVLLDINNLEKQNLSEILDINMENEKGFGSIPNEICKILKISEKDKIIINRYIKDLIVKSEQENNNLELEIEKLFKYKYNDINNTNDKLNLMMNSKNKKLLYKKCKDYDYKNKHKITFNYFKHLFKEICYKNKRQFSSIEFYKLLYECKKFNGNEIYCFNDILYENLIENENNENNNIINLNTEYKLKYPDLVNNFLDKIIKEAYDKKKENFGNNQLNRARSFEKDFFEEELLDNNINKNKLNLEGGDD